MKCSSCGAEASGRFCAQCGAPLSRGARRCSKCGGQLKPADDFCSDCGEPTGPRQRKPVSAHLPWVLSFTVLAAFSLAIALFVQRHSRARAGDDPITGGLPELQSAAGGSMPSQSAIGGPVGDGGMPDLASMSPREAADRLFDRAMRESERNTEQASFFANMALQAYGQVPQADLDLDALFHVGLLHLEIGDATTAGTLAENMLAGNGDYLLGLVLARRAAAASAEGEVEAEYVRRLQEAVGSGELDRLPEYKAHREMIEREAGVVGETGESAPAEDDQS